MSDEPRWTATVFYRTENGLLDVEHRFEEIAELHNLVEYGPNFYAIDRIEIRLSGGRVDPMTVEHAAREGLV